MALLTEALTSDPICDTGTKLMRADGVPVDTPSLVPYTNIYSLLALIGTAAILLV